MSSGRQRKDYELGMMDEMWTSLRRYDLPQRTRVLQWLQSKSETMATQTIKDFLKADVPHTDMVDVVMR